MSAKGRLVLLWVSFFVAATSACAFGQTAVPIEQAAKDGKAELTITGIGGSTGDTILVIVRRKVPEVLRLTLTPGTVFKSTTGTVQNMAGAVNQGGAHRGELVPAGSKNRPDRQRQAQLRG